MTLIAPIDIGHLNLPLGLVESLPVVGNSRHQSQWVRPPMLPSVTEWRSIALDGVDHSTRLRGNHCDLIVAEEAPPVQLRKLVFIFPRPGHVWFHQYVQGAISNQNPTVCAL